MIIMVMMIMMERTTHLEKMSSSTLEVGLASVSIFQLILILERLYKINNRKEMIKSQRKR